MVRIRSLAVLLFLCLPLSAQVFVGGPTPQGWNWGGSTIPFGGTSSTYLLLVEPTELGTQPFTVRELAFVPTEAATWTASGFKLAIGHVPLGLFNFAFPQISGGAVSDVGDFHDLTVLYDSDVSGPLTWEWRASAWSPLGISSPTSPSWSWNGSDALAVYISFDQAVATPGNQGLFINGPYGKVARHVGTGFSAVAQNHVASSALAVRLSSSLDVPDARFVGANCTTPGGAATLHTDNMIPALGNLGFGFRMEFGSPGQLAHLYASFGLAASPLAVGHGCDLYLDLTSAVSLINAGITPWAMSFDAQGSAWFPLPVPNDPALGGLQAAFQGVAFNPTLPGGWRTTRAIEITIF